MSKPKIIHFKQSGKLRSLKIAIFHLGFFFSGGGEKLVLKEAGGLTKLGHKVTLFAPVIDKEDCFPDLIKEAKVHSLFFPFSFNFPLRDFLAIAGAVFLTPLTFWRFKSFDIFFGANQPGPLICFFLAKILRKPYVIYLAQPTRLIYPRKVDREVGFGKGSFDIFFFLAQIFKPIVAFLDRISVQGASAILANGEYMAKILEKVYKIKVIVCPAGCHPKKTLPNFNKRWQGTVKIGNTIIPKPFILLTNRHFPQKKIEYAIQALSLIKNSFPNISLVITGAPTAHTDYLQQVVSHLGLKKKVVFTNLISEKNLDKLYSQAALYVYTSPEEDFGMGIIEAMAWGTPVVAWNYAGPTVTVIDGITGFLAKPNQLDDYAKKIIKILTNPELGEKMGRASHRRAEEKFSYQIHNQILEETFSLALKNYDKREQIPVDYYQSANFWQRLWHNKKWQTVGSLLTKKEKKILDLGCASGYSTCQIGRFVPQAEIVGIDVSEKLIKFAKKKYPSFKFLIANGEDLPFGDKSFDTVICTEVLEHLVSPKKVLQEIQRVLTPRGKLILELDAGSPLFRLIWFFWSHFFRGKVWDDSHLHRFTVKKLEDLLRGNGFLIEKKIVTHLGMAVTFLASKRG